MDTAKLLAELERSDAICAAVRGWCSGPSHHPHDVVVCFNHNNQSDNAAFVDHCCTELPARNQQLREALSRIAELEAVVVPLERLLRSGITTCIDIDDGEYCVEPYSTKGDIDGVDYRAATLAEALSAAVKAMEDAT